MKAHVSIAMEVGEASRTWDIPKIIDNVFWKGPSTFKFPPVDSLVLKKTKLNRLEKNKLMTV